MNVAVMMQQVVDQLTRPKKKTHKSKNGKLSLSLV